VAWGPNKPELGTRTHDHANVRHFTVLLPDKFAVGSSARSSRRSSAR
jgi:hypothetical protein